MNSLLEIVQSHCSVIQKNPFFHVLDRGLLDNMMYMYQLRYWCNSFIECLFLSVACCPDQAHRNIRRRHALEEGNHPDQLDKWMSENGFDLSKPLAPTQETVGLHLFVRGIAAHGTPIEMYFILNALSERVALNTFRSMIAHHGQAKLRGPYFHTHQEVDEHHSAMGSELITSEALEPEREMVEKLLLKCSYLYSKMLASWAVYL